MGCQVIAIADLKLEIEGFHQASGGDLLAKQHRINQCQSLARHGILRGELGRVED